MSPIYISPARRTTKRNMESRRKFFVKVGVISMGAIFLPDTSLLSKLQTEFKKEHKGGTTQYRRVVPRVI